MDLHTLVLVIHYIVCIFLVIVILLQAGKGADAGAAFGAGSSGNVFGPRGAATFLSKITTVAAIVFLITSMLLASFSRQSKNSVISPEVVLPGAESQAETQASITEQDLTKGTNTESKPTSKKKIK